LLHAARYKEKRTKITKDSVTLFWVNYSHVVQHATKDNRQSRSNSFTLVGMNIEEDGYLSKVVPLSEATFKCQGNLMDIFVQFWVLFHISNN